ncbi:hypothetical protein C8J55DRAFT_601472, partial [Lentinula edodes]
MASATYPDEKYPHQLKVDIYNINDTAIPPPLSVAARPNSRKTTFLRLLTVVGLAVACTIAFIHGFPKGSMPTVEDGVYPNVVLKEPGGFTTMERNPAYLVEAQNGVVATENKRCSDMGVIALRKGGSAVDAAITATLCIGVVNSF